MRNVKYFYERTAAGMRNTGQKAEKTLSLEIDMV